MKFKVLVLVLTVVISECSGQSDYCDPALCTRARGAHVACNAPEEFGPACGKEPKYVPMDTKLKTIILDKHNELRAEIARGMHGFPQAARMPTLVWNDELAKISTFNARNCTLDHDKCRNTKEFPFSGQNLAIIWYRGYNYQPEDRVTYFIQQWFNEHKDCPKSYIDKYLGKHQGPQIGHFTQMVNDRVSKVGCSLVHYPTNQDNKATLNYYFVCNYSMTNIVGGHVYSKGKTASKCKTGPNLQFKDLCSAKEEVESKP
ncbi:AAEL009239-PA [Aedes aegypti]|uniref:Venom allergen-1 n=2 Tax=Aedes aegypti TaxID=7159 RepID=A0A903UHN0_AEDAE|nr:venom allergen 5 [Aedes aegypti]EAT38906.1 AAEL009239-PA [Aedes aegypti]